MKKRGSNVNMFYSTPSRYLKAVHDSNIAFDTKSDDFFPYASDSHSFWTGYFTSRPALKRFERIGNHYLQMCKRLSVFLNQRTSKFEENLDNLREIMGVMQHHDAVSGTEKQYVAEDYARSLQIGIDRCSENIVEALNQLSHSKNQTFDTFQKTFDYKSCADLNISSCDITENSDQFMITLYNPLSHSTSQYGRLPIRTGFKYEVRDAQNLSMRLQVVPIPAEIQSISYRRGKANMELVFLADKLPPLGYKSYFVQKQSKSSAIPIVDSNRPFTIGSKYLSLYFDVNGLLASAACEGVKMNVRQNFYIYESFDGYNTSPEDRSSGAYIFRPKSKALKMVDHASVTIIRGELVDEVHQVSWIDQNLNRRQSIN